MNEEQSDNHKNAELPAPSKLAVDVGDETGQNTTNAKGEQRAALEPSTGTVDRAASATPLVDGNLWHAIWLMSWPLLLLTIAMSLVGMADVQVAGHLGAPIQAAVGLSEQVLFVFMVFLQSVSTGTTAVVARHFGEKNIEGSVVATAQSLVIAVAGGMVLLVAALFFSQFMLPLFSQSSEVQMCGIKYLNIYAWFLIPYSVSCVAHASFRAIGDARTPLIIIATQSTINIAGDYLTVFGNWPVAGLGVTGIAWSGVVASSIGALMAIVLLARSPLGAAFRQLFPLEKAIQLRILKIGLPSAIQRLGWAASVFFVFFILRMVKEPTAALAAWTIGMRVEALLFMPLMALSLAVSSIVGQNLGAKKQERAIKAGWDVTNIGVVLMVVLGTVLFLGADQIAAFMTTDAQTRIATREYLRIGALGEPPLAVAMILSGALQGAGDTKMPMWVSIFTNWIVRLPLAWLLALTLDMGTPGVWWAMTMSITVYAALMIWRYKEGSWIHTKV